MPTEEPIAGRGDCGDAGRASSLRGLLRCNAAAVACGAGGSLVVVLGSYLGALAADLGPLRALLTALALGWCWLALAGPVLAASGRGGWSIALRGGAVADGLGVALLVVWLTQRASDPQLLSMIDVLRVYLLWAGAAVMAMALVACFRSRAGRLATAAAVAALLMAALASPFWSGGLLAAGDWDFKLAAAGWLVRINPFFVVTQMLAPATNFAWPSAPLVYELSRLGDYVPPPRIEWFQTLGLYLAVAAVAGLAAAGRALLCARRRRPISD
jgi:hypothetical protein